MALAKLKLATFGHFLVEELKSGGSCAKDLIIRCKDGDVLLHKVLVASLSKSLFKILKQNSEDEVIQVILPDTSKFHASMLVQILYTGEASGIKKEDVDEIKSLANLLKFKSASFSLSVNTEESKSVSYRMDLQIEMIERKRKEKPSVVIPNVDDVETANVRRSRRPKFKAKKLDGFETKILRAKSEQTTIHKEEKRKSESQTVEKKIANFIVKVTHPKDEDLELKHQSPTMLNSDIGKVCLACGKRLLGKFALSKHLKLKHHQGSFPCNDCEEVFPSGQSLHEHARMRKHGTTTNQRAYKKTTYQCDINDCKSQFSTFNTFQTHTIRCHNLFPLECKICKKRYKEQSTFKNHKETHESILKYQCDICQKKFVTRERLFAHRRLHLGKRYECTQPQCEFKARSSTALRNHIKMKHLERKFQCLICSKKFGSKQNLEQHEVIHSGEVNWHCSPCSQAFKRQHHFKAHMNSLSHKNKTNETVPLDSKRSIPQFHLKPKVLQQSSRVEDIEHQATSDFSLVIPLNLEQNMPKFNDEDLIDLADNNSSELFLEDNNVQFIIVNEGNQDVMLMTSDEVKLSDAASEDKSDNDTVQNERKNLSKNPPSSPTQLPKLNTENGTDLPVDWKANFSDNVYKICYICKTSFVGLFELTKHLRTHLDVQCIECSRNFPTALGMHEHLRVRFKSLNFGNGEGEATPKTYNCREQGCTYQGFTIKMYREHVFKCHGIQKAFFCDTCGKSYKLKSNLEEHILKHKSILFTCDKCDKKFSSKSGLYVHRREQHSSSLVRSVKCDVCSFVSKGMRNLKKHKETHNKASYSRYSCSYCHKTFRNRNSLNVHTLVHTGEQPYRCNVCLKSFKRSHHLYSHLNCVDHKNKLEQRKMENLPDPIYSVTKPSFQTMTSDNVNHPIYMEVTDANGSNATVQVVSEIETHSSITADQFAVLLASTDEYKEYIMENEDE